MTGTLTNENIYIMLPRFVKGRNAYNKSKHLLPLKREFEWNGIRCDFFINPATLIGNDGKAEHHYPGKREELIENTVRQLAVESNINFEKESLTLCFSLDQISEKIKSSARKPIFDREELKKGLQILSIVFFELSNSKGELIFRPFLSMESLSEDNEIYYKVRFPLIFFETSERFNSLFRY